MAVKLQGQHTFDAARDRVWAALLDPEVLARTLPGCEQLEQIGENQFKGALKVKVGPVQGAFNGTVTLSDLVPPESYTLDLEGQGPSGFMNGNGSLRLEDDAEADSPRTILHYDVDAQVGGRIAGVGQRLLDSSAKVITRQALEGLGRQLEAQAPEATSTENDSPGSSGSSGSTDTDRTSTDGESANASPAPPAEPIEAPSQAEFAGEFAKGLLGELIPPERRPVIAILGLLVIGILAFLIVRGCT